jgi:hypothetical protein
MAKAIYVKFLKSSAPLHVSIMDGTRRKIQMAIQLRGEPDCTLFTEAQREIYQQMEANELRQFLCSDAFTECSQFNGLVNVSTDMNFQPSHYRTGGSLHSSDDSTSITSFTSEDIGSTHTHVLCLPPHTRLTYTPRNAHSDTEHSTRSHHHGHHRGMREASLTTHYSRNKVLTQNEFYEILYERLSTVQRERANMKQHARNIAREQGKPYEVIMSMEWHDAPEAIKYVKFDENESDNTTTTTTIQLNNETEIHHQLYHHQPTMYDKTSPSTLDITKIDITEEPVSTTNNSHILSIAAREIQEAVKDLDITRQVRQKRSTLSSSASSYISDSGVGEGFLPSSGSGPLGRPHPSRVQTYLQNQQRYTSQLSERDAQAQLAATMLINNNVPREDLNPIRNRYYPGAYSSDDSSSCFTATSQSSNSEFFVPRRMSNMYGGGGGETTDDGRQIPQRYPPGMRRSGNHPSRRPNTASSRYSLNNSTTAVPQPNIGTTSTVPQPSAAVHDSLLVAYTIEGFTNTLAKRLNTSSLTLGDFKDKVFNRRGQYRFFFKSYCEELNDVILEEMTEDTQSLPLYEGKIVGHVERVNE